MKVNRPAARLAQHLLTIARADGRSKIPIYFGIVFEKKGPMVHGLIDKASIYPPAPSPGSSGSDCLAIAMTLVLTAAAASEAVASIMAPAKSSL